MKGGAGLSIANLEKLADHIGLEIVIRSKRAKGE